MPFGICGQNPLIDDPTLNLTYDEILATTPAEFVDYITRMRAEVLRLWDDEGIAPAKGWSKWNVIDEFKQLADFPVHKFWDTDKLTGRRVINNAFTVGNAVNAWTLGQMLKTRINYTEKDKGRSIYDFFAKDDYFKRYLPYARRHFLRDSFYFFAQSVAHGTPLPHRPAIVPTSPVHYCELFAEHERAYGEYELLIEPKKTDVVYTGYAGHLNTTALLTDTFMALSYDELMDLTKRGVLTKVCIRIIRPNKELSREYAYHIRLYAKGQRIFPRMFASFRVSMCQYAVNFPPLTAKLLYDTFLKHVPGEAFVWDPSAGWAGRVLGAMASEHPLHYVGTDPNPAFYDNFGNSMYGSVVDFYNNVRSGQSLFGDHNSAKVMCRGSEDFIDASMEGVGDLVFTSPPYFNREAYSEAETQSYKKFSTYDVWRDGFLRPTIEGAWRFLKSDRYFLWNIADLKVGKGYLPLEGDSLAIAKSVGFEYKETILMTLKGMPGANRVTADGVTAKNFCNVTGRMMKFEPVHVFYKP